jgi:hypothetical protein
MSTDRNAGSRMPAEVDGKQVVVSALRCPPSAYGSLDYTYLVIVDEARRDDDGMNMYTVGRAVYSHAASAWELRETRVGMANAAAIREFATLAQHAARRAQGK